MHMHIPYDIYVRNMAVNMQLDVFSTTVFCTHQRMHVHRHASMQFFPYLGKHVYSRQKTKMRYVHACVATENRNASCDYYVHACHGWKRIPPTRTARLHAVHFGSAHSSQSIAVPYTHTHKYASYVCDVHFITAAHIHPSASICYVYVNMYRDIQT